MKYLFLILYWILSIIGLICFHKKQWPTVDITGVDLLMFLIVGGFIYPIFLIVSVLEKIVIYKGEK